MFRRKKIRWGIIATGNISSQFATALNDTKGAELLACASRSQASADRFGKQFKVARCYEGYNALVADPDVEVVYIGTPHNLHYENMKLCLNAGKHVLCEKPMTLNARETAECIALARSRGLFLMEAVWMRFIPAIRQLKSWVQSGLIGDVQMISADFHFNLPFDANHRLYNPELGGGALLDLGIYPLNFAVNLLGFPEHIDARATLGPTGIDEISVYQLDYANGAKAQLSSGMRVNRPIVAAVYGTLGWIEVPDFFLRPDKLIVHLNDKKPKTHKIPYRSNGYVHEIDEVHRCLSAGLLESDVLPTSDTQQMMTLFDTLRQQWGVRYPSEM